MRVVDAFHPAVLFLTISLTLPTTAPAQTDPGEQPSCQVVSQGDTVELRSQAFIFRLDVAEGLRARDWENRLTGRRRNLANGPELEFDLGQPGQPLATPKLRVTHRPSDSNAPIGEAVFELASADGAATATVTYRWDSEQAVLHKFVTITNHSAAQWDRLLNVRLGTYPTDAPAETPDPDFPIQMTQSHQGGPIIPIEDPVGRKRGFPAYVEGQFFLSLAHPAGFAKRTGAEIALYQLPGKKLAPGATFTCMETVYGVSRDGAARQAFLDHLQSRMRRVLRHHDHPVAIFEPFGAKPDGDFWATEDYILDNLRKLAEGRQQSGLQWDYYSVDFWHDPAADLKAPAVRLFPNGFTKVFAEIRKLGMQPGLWVDSGAIPGWTVGDNPAVKNAITKDGLCRATPPANQFYIDGFTHQLRENGVRLLKFDNLLDRCEEPTHEHLPGDYSTEPICDAIIDCYRVLDRECPDVFLMLYWGYQSPWWLLHADTLFDAGTRIEAASFATLPTLRARESVSRRLDQARWMVKDLPVLGWDPLGVWLSDWPWNSRVGKEAWQEGVVMDLCRGHLMAQLWSDTPYLSPPERAQMADFITLLKTHPECFRNSRFILGNPWKNEPYGYCCTDGKRAFIALNNGVWQDSTLPLELNSKWGLADGRKWTLYRLYPQPARLKGEVDGTVTSAAKIALRPMQIVLLEAVPAGEAPTLKGPFEESDMPHGFTEPSRDLPLTAGEPADDPQSEPKVAWTVLPPTEFRSTGGAKLNKLDDGSLLAGGDNPSPDTYLITTSSPLDNITAIRLEALPDDSLPAHGPGRAENGNFTLLEFTVSVTAPGDPGNARPEKFARADASFSQISHGGWPVAAAIDGHPETGWGIHPNEGTRQVAVFECARPIRIPTGGHLDFKLDQYAQGHSIGHLRLSATSAPLPIRVPKPGKNWVWRGQIPPAAHGGILALCVDLQNSSQAYWTKECREGFEVAATLSGQPTTMEAVVNNGWYPATWQTWKITVAPASAARPFEFNLTGHLPDEVQHRFSAHFVPRDEG